MTNTSSDCQFCLQNELLKGGIVSESANGFLIEALYSPGYYLAVPKQHAETVAQLSDDWWKEMKLLVSAVPGLSGAYNISLNVGKDAGQTVGHLHFWIIPRQPGKPSSGKGFAALIAEADGTEAAE